MATTIIVILAALLVAFAVYRTVQKARGKAKSSCCGGPEMITAKKVDDTDPTHYPYKYKLSISGMSCSNCARRVENALNALDGTWAKVDLARQQAEVLTKQEADAELFRKTLEKESYTVTACTAAD